LGAVAPKTKQTKHLSYPKDSSMPNNYLYRRIKCYDVETKMTQYEVYLTYVLQGSANSYQLRYAMSPLELRARPVHSI
jgi:hypothetical protein